MKLNINTGIMHVISVGMHETQLDPRHVFEKDEDKIKFCIAITDEEKNYLLNAPFNVDVYKKVVAKYAMHALKDLFEDLNNRVGIRINLCEGGSITSPKEYNFRTDELDFTIEIEKSELDKVLPNVTGNEKFWTWAERNYRSRSGFWSFMPWSEDEFIEAIQGKDIERAISMYMTFVFMQSGGYSFNPYEYSIFEAVSGNYGYVDFIDDVKALEIYGKMVAAEAENASIPGQITLGELFPTET